MKLFFTYVAVLILPSVLLFPQSVSYSVTVKPIFQKYGCLGCHGGSGNLFLEPYAQIFTTGLHAPVVVPNDVNSILIQKLDGRARFGSRMPQGGDPISAADLNTIIQWIQQGAPEHDVTAVHRTDRSTGSATFTLEQNFPNPFNPSTEIGFDIIQRSDISLRLYDRIGREVRVLAEGTYNPGRYSIRLEAFDLPSGLYYYRLNTGNAVRTRSMLLIR